MGIKTQQSVCCKNTVYNNTALFDRYKISFGSTVFKSPFVAH